MKTAGLLSFLLSLLFSMPLKTALAQCSVAMPLKQLKVNSAFGRRTHPLTGCAGFHQGVDLAAHADTVYCILAGIVTGTGSDLMLGNYIEVTHAGGLQSIYGHLSEIAVYAGEQVSAAEAIGISGSSGRVTGPHLHFAIKYKGRFISPLAFLAGLAQ